MNIPGSSSVRTTCLAERFMIGVDVSKDHLDAHRLADGASRRFANDKRGHKALVKWLAPILCFTAEEAWLVFRPDDRPRP